MQEINDLTKHLLVFDEFLDLDSGFWTPLYICVFMYLYIPDVYIAPSIYM